MCTVDLLFARCLLLRKHTFVPTLFLYDTQIPADLSNTARKMANLKLHQGHIRNFVKIIIMKLLKQNTFQQRRPTSTKTSNDFVQHTASVTHKYMSVHN
jgi:hypothetical protein